MSDDYRRIAFWIRCSTRGFQAGSGLTALGFYDPILGSRG